MAGAYQGTLRARQERRGSETTNATPPDRHTAWRQSVHSECADLAQALAFTSHKHAARQAPGSAPNWKIYAIHRLSCRAGYSS